MHLFKNDSGVYGEPIPSLYSGTLDREAPLTARRYFSALATYQPTPLLRLGGLAHSLGVGKLIYKDEGHRLGLQSFKALGGAYAVARLIHQQLQTPIEGLLEMRFRKHAREITVACATDGNHGRSVAWGAQLLGCQCVIFLHEGVSKAREQAISDLGATIVRVPGVYDDSCAEATRVSNKNGWHLVSDFSTAPYHEVTSWVMQGYTLMVDEILQVLQERNEAVSHIFVQGGCGGLAAAVAGHFAVRVANKPIVVVVEPDRANCLLRSAASRAIAKIEVGEPTCMTMLECYEPSHMAWPILERTVEYFMDIPDEASAQAALRLAAPLGGDPVVRTTTSGAAGLAGLLAVSGDEASRQVLSLHRDASVLIIGSEGAME